MQTSFSQPWIIGACRGSFVCTPAQIPVPSAGTMVISIVGRVFIITMPALSIDACQGDIYHAMGNLAAAELSRKFATGKWFVAALAEGEAAFIPKGWTYGIFGEGPEANIVSMFPFIGPQAWEVVHECAFNQCCVGIVDQSTNPQWAALQVWAAVHEADPAPATLQEAIGTDSAPVLG